MQEKIKGILDYLTIKKSDKLPVGLSGIIPEATKLNQVTVTDHIATLDFSKELFQGMAELEERIVEGIAYSILNLEEINGVTLKVEGVLVQELPSSKKKIPEVIDKSFGINKVYDIDNRNGIQKVTLYYIDQIDNENYYVPVTRYMNDDREKINIIIESLASDYIYESNLMSFLNQDTELIDYQIEDELMLLNFNHSIFSQDKVLEEVSYSIAYSVFDNYDVNTVLLEVEGIEVGKIEKGK